MAIENRCPNLGHRNDPDGDPEKMHTPLPFGAIIDREDNAVRSPKNERDKAVARGEGNLMSFWCCWVCGVVFRSSAELRNNKPPPEKAHDLKTW
jgi:hypothetical protein